MTWFYGPEPKVVPVMPEAPAVDHTRCAPEPEVRRLLGQLERCLAALAKLGVSAKKRKAILDGRPE